MLNEFKQYLLGIGKSENTALNYCDKVKLYFKWCLDSFGSEPQQLYRANVLDYISYMKTIKRYNPKSVNNHLSSLRSFNEFLIASGRQTELAIVTGTNELPYLVDHNGFLLGQVLLNRVSDIIEGNHHTDRKKFTFQFGKVKHNVLVG